MHILLIEDDRRLARLIDEELTATHIRVDTTHDGDSGLDLLLRGIYDVAVIDWMLPGRDGPALCRAARAERVRTGLLMLTARTQIEDRVTGLESGADDYLIKPFAFAELIARVQALARRCREDNGQGYELRHNDLVMDTQTHTVRRGEHRIELTSIEWRLLEFLLRHPGQALSRQQILDYVWSYEHDVQASLVDVYISYLRRKLDQSGQPDPIQTVRGVGYRLKKDP